MILVTGGTGMVGSHLLYFLLKENERVRAIHRKGSDLLSVKQIFALYTTDVDLFFNRIEWVEANITDIPELSTAFIGVSRVYHCAAFISFDPSKYKIIKKINVEGTANIVNLCLANNIEKLCYVSSVSTLGRNQKAQLINEESPWNPDERNSVYAITKYGAEMEVWRGTQEGLDAVIANPGIILGTSPDNRGSGLLISLGKSGIPFHPSGAMGVVDVTDVARALLLLMASKKKNQQYILVGENISYKELFTRLAILFGKKPPRIRLPKGLLLFLSEVEWLFGTLFGTERRIPKATVHAMFATSIYDTSKIKEELGFHFTPTADTLSRIVQETKGKSD